MNNFNLDEFVEVMALHRIRSRKLSLRDAAAEIGISASTLNRIESRRQIPDLLTYYKCCEWCECEMEQFFIKTFKP